MDGAGTGQGAAAVRCLPGGTAELAGGSAGWAVGSAGGAAGEHGPAVPAGGDGGSGGAAAVLFCATTLLAVLFTAGSYPRIRAFLRRQLPEDRLRQARGVKADLLATLGKWCKAQCILLGVTFCELLTGFLLLRQGYALLLAALIAVIDALPVFGTGTVLVPWGALCLLTGNVPKGLGLLALYGVISLVRSVLEPKIMAAQVDLPPLAALAAMYVGFCAFGVAGMVLCPMALLFVKQLHDSGWLRLWK